VISRIRLEHHAGCIASGRSPDNRVDPRALPPLRRVSLREALRAVAAAQRQLMVYARPGI
jgi:signal-transduction protein with cAMP-binding, CBS, and nucleotidyltransferase domain